jgi:hypothetical protein
MFGDVGAQSGHVVDDRIGQASVVGTNGGDDDLHGDGGNRDLGPSRADVQPLGPQNGPQL